MPLPEKPSNGQAKATGDQGLTQFSALPELHSANSMAGALRPSLHHHAADDPDSVAPANAPGSSGSSLHAQLEFDGEIAEYPAYIGEYKVLGVLGRGGMGIVFRVKNPFFDFEQALKMIREEFDSRTARELFIKEMKTQAELENAHIVKVYYAGVHREAGRRCGQPYFVMSLESGDLGTAIQKSPLAYTPEAAANIVRRLARSIGLAHARGTFHCDLKPKNILLDAGGVPKITDFGLVKLLADTRKDGAFGGDAFGTPSYMPPEQAEGDYNRVDARSDVYGLGAILYELLTGRPPFKGDSNTVTLYLVKTAPPDSIRKTHPQVPARLEAICLKCLEKDPAKRFQSAAELEGALDEYLQPHWCKRHWKKLAVGAGFAAMLALSIAVVHARYKPRWEAEQYLVTAQDAKQDADKEATPELRLAKLSEARVLYLPLLKSEYMDHNAISQELERIGSEFTLISAVIDSEKNSILAEEAAKEARKEYSLGKRGEAIRQFENAIRYYIASRGGIDAELHSKRGVLLAQTYSDLAELRVDAREYDQAMTEFGKAKTTLDELSGDRDSRIHTAIARISHIRGYCQFSQSNWSGALREYDAELKTLEVLDVSKDSSDYRTYQISLARAHGYRGDAQMMNKDADAAKKSYLLAKAIRGRLAVDGGDDEKCKHARDYGNLATLDEWCGNTAGAIEHRRERLKFYQDHLSHLAILPGQDRTYRASSHIGLVELLLDAPTPYASVYFTEVEKCLTEAEAEYARIRTGVESKLKKTPAPPNEALKFDAELSTCEAAMHLARAKYILVRSRFLFQPNRIGESEKQLGEAETQLEALDRASLAQPSDYYNLAAVLALRSQLATNDIERLEHSTLALDRLRKAVERGFLGRKRLERDFAFSGIRLDPRLNLRLQKLLGELPDPSPVKPQADR